MWGAPQCPYMGARMYSEHVSRMIANEEGLITMMLVQEKRNAGIGPRALEM